MDGNCNIITEILLLQKVNAKSHIITVTKLQ